MPQRTKNDKETSIINQKQHFQSSMGCYNSIGICCSMVLDTKLSKDFKLSIKIENCLFLTPILDET